MDESTVLDDGENETDSDDDDEVEEAAGHEDDRNTRRTPEPFDGVVYFKVTAINYEPLVALEEDFRSSASSKARAGELGCWIDVGERGETQMVLEGVERDRIANRSAEKEWFRIRKSDLPAGYRIRLPVIASTYRPFSQPASMRLRDLLGACLPIGESSRLLQLSILVKGARGAGKRSLIQAIVDEIGLNVITVRISELSDLVRIDS
jgi:peroxin-6